MTNFEKVVTFNRRVAELKEQAGLEPTSFLTQYQLIKEEFQEVTEAFFNWRNSSDAEVYNTHLELVKESLDLLYVVYGLLALLEVDADSGFDAVHENNMNKFNGARFNSAGKLIKPEGFIKMMPEDLARALYGDNT